jgi:uncharacterized protein with NAD-binding domain and iron-sulfur cluster
MIEINKVDKAMKAEYSRICIIGAGAAGLSAAYYLKQRGYTKVTVLEQSSRVGGKCRTVDFQGRSFDIGANYVTAAYSEVLKFARRFGAVLYTESAAITANASNRGTVTFSSPLTAIARRQNLLSFVWAAIRYFWLRFRLRDIIDIPGFGKISSHAELCVSFRDWLASNRLSALEPIFEAPITIMGYGYLDEIPAPYALKYLNLATYRNLVAVALGLPTRWPKRFVDGFERLWCNVAQQIDVRLGTNISLVERRGPIEIHTSNAGIMEFDYLILACPLNADLLGRFLTLSDEERDLFKRIIVNDYVVTTYAIPNLRLPKRIIGMTPIPEMGRPWAITQQFADNDFVQFYTRMDDPHSSAEEIVIDGIRQLVTALGAALPEKYITHDEWAYFPHIAVEDFGTGFYDRLEGLQGRSNTFYCGGLAAFELVETVVQYSRSLIETYF